MGITVYILPYIYYLLHAGSFLGFFFSVEDGSNMPLQNTG
jgi:hypothetical protein